MSSSSAREPGSASASQRVRQIVLDVIRRRADGVELADQSVMDQHPDLQHELACELKKLRRIGDALVASDEDNVFRAWQKLQEDIARDAIDAARSSANRLTSVSSDDDSFELGPVRRPLPLGESDTRSRDIRPNRRASGRQDVPEMIGRYRISRMLGSGGFGRVYLAVDQHLERQVAIKVAHRRTDDDAQFQEFLAEARIAAGLDHPAIVPVYDAGRTEDGVCFVVSKLISGEDLESMLKRTRLSHFDAASILIVVAEALEHAHRSGLVHRDIKPANILLDRNRSPFLADFGLALTDPDFGPRQSFAGTPSYMSPEQARGEAHRVDGRSDIFSMGIVFYELLTGSKPFTAETHAALLEQIIWDAPVPPRQRDANIPAEFERICLKALAKRAADRYGRASEMVEDLRCCLDEQVAAASDDTDGRAGTPVVSQLVPKGLHSFDADDADFFLELVPGPRDRDGLPESIRQWKRRIESFDPSKAFSVGLMYGPSGCGKSSLVCAGLLPRLADHVDVIYLPASGDTTERRLAERLRLLSPDLPVEANLSELVAMLRRGHRQEDGRKLLIVLDQFEQWLHGNSTTGMRELVQAIRQCDGRHVQCLLLVRDDFWLAVSRFMVELEVELVQGHNAALVDLFDVSHARQVLAKFGRAFGHLPRQPEEWSVSNEAFLERAISELAEEDKVIPVRLALFAEMFKGSPWTPAVLREVGGSAGIGVTFLEEAFTGRRANPQSRFHEPAARAILEALLPDPSSPIKGHIKSHTDLLEISGYGRNPRLFKDLMRILDSETRLITPTDPIESGVAERSYQLTHDYLVPSIREWLTRKQRQSRSGRTEIRLAERAMMWNAKPERRQLPSLWEWLAIRAMTRPAHWTQPQRRMMRVATRRHVLSLSTVCVMFAVFLFAGSELGAYSQSLWGKLRANTAAVWVALGQDEVIWPLLQEDADPNLRTGVIHGLGRVVTESEELVDNFQNQQDLGTARAVLLIAGELAGGPESLANSTPTLTYSEPAATVVQKLLTIYRDHPDPGVHSAAEWTLRRYRKEDSIAATDRRLKTLPRGDRDWYLTEYGQTMIVIPGPTQFTMGSPPDGAQHGNDESLHSQRIRRNYSIASKEITREQFQRFLREQPGLFADESINRSPQTQISWYQAAAYCNWLSLNERIPQDQWCYEPNNLGRYEAGMTIAADDHNRRGYRLPTEAEWEYACRANATTSYSFGEATKWLHKYAVAGPEYSQPQAVAERKPNDFGLFDMHGNVAEWCQDHYRPYSANHEFDPPRAEEIQDAMPRVLRGGAFWDPLHRIRSAARQARSTSLRSRAIGFRIARSYP